MVDLPKGCVWGATMWANTLSKLAATPRSESVLRELIHTFQELHQSDRGGSPSDFKQQIGPTVQMQQKFSEKKSARYVESRVIKYAQC